MNCDRQFWDSYLALELSIVEIWFVPDIFKQFLFIVLTGCRFVVLVPLISYGNFLHCWYICVHTVKSRFESKVQTTQLLMIPGPVFVSVQYKSAAIKLGSRFNFWISQPFLPNPESLLSGSQSFSIKSRKEKCPFFSFLWTSHPTALCALTKISGLVFGGQV